MDTPSESHHPRRKKVKTRIRVAEDPTGHILFKREARLRRLSTVAKWTFGALAFVAVVYILIFIWDSLH